MEQLAIAGYLDQVASSVPSGEYQISPIVARKINASGISLELQHDAPHIDLPPGSRWQLGAKRAIDLVLSLIALVVLGPLLCLVAIAIKSTSPGPVFFGQVREGKDGKPFVALKFRSMRTDLCDSSGTSQTKVDDPRVTPVGKFIRRTSIDELPQLFNVMLGHMSIVGPRPHVSGMYAGGMLYRDLVKFYDVRLMAMPGLTGWAQANGFRGSTENANDAVARIEHDIAYIQNFSIWLDIKIMYLTFKREFFTGSGY